MSFVDTAYCILPTAYCRLLTPNLTRMPIVRILAPTSRIHAGVRHGHALSGQHANRPYRGYYLAGVARTARGQLDRGRGYPPDAAVAWALRYYNAVHLVSRTQ